MPAKMTDAMTMFVENRDTDNPKKNRKTDRCSVPMIIGVIMCSLKRFVPADRYAWIGPFTCGEPRLCASWMYRRDHCWTIVAVRAHERDRTKLRNQRELTHTADEEGPEAVWWDAI